MPGTRRSGVEAPGSIPLSALDVELFGDLGVLADQVAYLDRKLLGLGFPGLDHAEALRVLVGDPRAVGVGLESRPDLLESRLRVGEVPKQEADDHGTGTARPSAPSSE